MLWSLTVFLAVIQPRTRKTASDFASFSNELNDVEEIIFKEAKWWEKREKDAYYNKRCRCVMIDVVSHVDGRCLGPAEINDRHPLRAQTLLLLSHSGRRKREKIEKSFSFSFLQQPSYKFFIFVGFHILWKGAPILDDEVGGASEKCKGKEN